MFEFTTEVERLSLKTSIEDTSRPVPQKLFDKIYEQISIPLREEFVVFQKKTIKDLKKAAKKEEKDKKKK